MRRTVLIRVSFAGAGACHSFHVDSGLRSGMLLSVMFLLEGSMVTFWVSV